MGSESFIKIERFPVPVITPLVEPAHMLAQRYPELRFRLIVTGGHAARRDKERASSRQLRSKPLAMRPGEIDQRRGGVGVVAIARYLLRQILRLQIPDVGFQIGARIGALDIEDLAA